MTMNILVLGASGMIGSAIVQNLSEGNTVYGTYYSHTPASTNRYFHFDVSNKDELISILRTTKPDVIVSSLRGDFAEQESRHKELAESLRETGRRLIFLSTANVFDGCPFELHSASDTPYPASSYGQFKFRCEQMLQKSLGDQLAIVRLPRVLNQGRVQMLLAKQNPEKPFYLYSNLFMSVNIAENVAREICFIIEHGLSGVFHLTSDDFVSHQDFYEKLFTKAGCKGIKVQKISMSIETYCAELGNVPAGILHGKDSGKLYLALSSNRNNQLLEFSLSCQNVIEELCP